MSSTKHSLPGAASSIRGGLQPCIEARVVTEKTQTDPNGRGLTLSRPGGRLAGPASGLITRFKPGFFSDNDHIEKQGPILTVWWDVKQ